MKNSNIYAKIEKQFAGFAINEISGHDEFHQMSQFPDEIWKKMADQRLFGIGIDEKFGGHGGDSRAISLAGSLLVFHGGNLGIAMTWMMHELISRWLISRFGRQNQQEDLLPKLAQGDITVSLAASEPNRGAHPKYMQTSAEIMGSEYRINGEKTYLTNGPLADIFIVIAVTGEHSGKKELSAFLVPKNATGLFINEPMDLPILKPSPHCGILLKDCIVGKDLLFGRIGSAHENIVKPFREIEDTLMMGPISGGLYYQLNELKRIIHQGNLSLDAEIILELGSLQCEAEALHALAMVAAERIDQPKDGPPVEPLTLYFRKQVPDFQDKMANIIKTIGVENDFHLGAMFKDIAGGIRIASNVSKLKLHRMGESFMSSPGRSI
jgi:alkylation response protein AidB-like acyl-CoA dehydrogenase